QRVLAEQAARHGGDGSAGRGAAGVQRVAGGAVLEGGVGDVVGRPQDDPLLQVRRVDVGGVVEQLDVLLGVVGRAVVDPVHLQRRQPGEVGDPLGVGDLDLLVDVLGGLGVE